MFWRKRKTPTDQVKADMDAIIQDLRPKWQYICEKAPFTDDVPLWERIEIFSVPAIEFMLENYPSTKHAPTNMIWMLIFTAVLESKTHPADEVNAAIAALAAKYGRD